MGLEPSAASWRTRACRCCVTARLNLTEAARRDFVDFLWDTERDYWWGMYRFLKDELGVRSARLRHAAQLQPGARPGRRWTTSTPIPTGTIPTFPAGPGTASNWYVRNVALVNSPGGTLAGLAARRVAGMAYTVSEYNHPAPNVYAAEGFPMIAAFGAFQAWDGIFPFAYCHNTDFEPRRIASYLRHQGRHGQDRPHAGLRRHVPPRRRRAGPQDGLGGRCLPEAEREKLCTRRSTSGA